MPMNATTLATAIVDAIETDRANKGQPALTAQERADLEDTWELIGGAIIDHISTDATVGLLDVDLDPVDGTPDGETIPATGVIS